MIHVIAAIRVKPGFVSEFLKIFKANVPKVRQEKGCVEYFPAVDVHSDLALQVLNENMVTVIEKWENLKSLYDHLNASHMLDYKEKVKDIVEDVSLKILQEA